MPPVRLVSHRQMEILVDFAEQNPDIAMNLNKSPHRYQQAAKAWDRLAKRLNAVGEGITKTPVKWKRYWHLLKCRAKAKSVTMKMALPRLEGGTFRTTPLTELEQKIVNISTGVKKEPVFNAVDHMMANYLEESCDQIEEAADRSDQQRVTLLVRKPVPRATLLPVAKPVVLTKTQPVVKAVPVPDPLEQHMLVRAADPLEQDETVPEDDEIEEYVLEAVPEVNEDTDSVEVQPENPSTRLRSAEGTRRRRNNASLDVPRWAYDLENRRIAAEERLAEAVVGLSQTNESILRCMRHMAATQTQLVEALRSGFDGLQALGQRNGWPE